MSLKQIEGNMSDFKERVTHVLYIMHKELESNQLWRGHGRVGAFNSVALATMLGGRWSQYRHKQMLELQKEGIVQVIKMDTGKFRYAYRLSNKEYDRMATRAFSQASQNYVHVTMDEYEAFEGISPATNLQSGIYADDINWK